MPWRRARRRPPPRGSPVPAPTFPRPRRRCNQQWQDWRALAANELAASQAEYLARRSTLPALAERAERMVLRAPLPGRVNRVLVTTVGGTVAPGVPLVEIVPSEELLLVETMIRPDYSRSCGWGRR